MWKKEKLSINLFASGRYSDRINTTDSWELKREDADTEGLYDSVWYKTTTQKEDNRSISGNVFMNIDTSKNYELALPILIGKLINVSLLEKEDISNFQKLLLSRYCQTTNSLTNYYIKPSGNNDIDIPIIYWQNIG